MRTGFAAGAGQAREGPDEEAGQARSPGRLVHVRFGPGACKITTGKAPARRNAEIMVVQEVMRWRREVERFSPERLDEFDAGIRHALEHPAALPRPEGR